MIDLRSDTVTRPTPGMRAAMAEAEVGDDVYRDDPTVNRLQDRVAEMLGFEAALLVPSGSMSNQVAIKAHTQPGDEILCEEYCHIYNWECGGAALLSGVTCRTVRGEHGILTVGQLADKVRPPMENMVRTKLVCLENTHNHGGGRIYPIEQIAAISDWARSRGLAMHLDGARLWNAAVATGVPLREWCRHFDSVSVCFSKGLGAPVGSALAGSRSWIESARRYRRVFGGGMRQAGVIAAAALYALDHHIDRLADDHRHAKRLAEAVVRTPGLSLPSPEVHTNLLWIDVDPKTGTASDWAAKLKQRGIVVGTGGPQILRMCTHLDVSADDIERVADELRRAAADW